MRPADLSPRAVPPIRRLVVVVLAAVLALVTVRAVPAGDGSAEPARPGVAVPTGAVAQVDEPAAEGLSAVLPTGRRASDHESLTPVPAAPTRLTSVAARPAWPLATDDLLPDGLLWAPLGARAPPARA
jgi:hypothetical protein